VAWSLTLVFAFDMTSRGWRWRRSTGSTDRSVETCSIRGSGSAAATVAHRGVETATR
jgi:hypothetical protein